MALLATLANKLANSVEHIALDTVAGIPRTGTERDMRRAHDQWLRTMRLDQTYYAEDARYYWVSTETNGGGTARLALMGGYTFTRRDHNGAYTASGAYSWNAWWRSGLKGLMYPEPPKPPKGKDLFVEADLRDAADRDRWEITYR